MRIKVILSCISLAGLPIISEASDLFEAYEMSVDVLGYYATHDKDGADKNAWGYGAGFNYFFTENIGAGVDTYSDAFTAPYMLNFSGVFRYPLRDTGFAPYGFAGFGRQWRYEPQWQGHVGGGIEYRGLHPGIGLFSDIRWVIPDRTPNYAVFRFGVRFKLGRF